MDAALRLPQRRDTGMRAQLPTVLVLVFALVTGVLAMPSMMTHASGVQTVLHPGAAEAVPTVLAASALGSAPTDAVMTGAHQASAESAAGCEASCGNDAMLLAIVCVLTLFAILTRLVLGARRAADGSRLPALSSAAIRPGRVAAARARSLIELSVSRT